MFESAQLNNAALFNFAVMPVAMQVSVAAKAMDGLLANNVDTLPLAVQIGKHYGYDFNLTVFQVRTNAMKELVAPVFRHVVAPDMLGRLMQAAGAGCTASPSCCTLRELASSAVCGWEHGIFEHADALCVLDAVSDCADRASKSIPVPSGRMWPYHSTGHVAFRVGTYALLGAVAVVGFDWGAAGLLVPAGKVLWAEPAAYFLGLRKNRALFEQKQRAAERKSRYREVVGYVVDQKQRLQNADTIFFIKEPTEVDALHFMIKPPVGYPVKALVEPLTQLIDSRSIKPQSGSAPENSL